MTDLFERLTEKRRIGLLFLAVNAVLLLGLVIFALR